MASLKGHAVLLLSEGDFKTVSEHFPSLSFALKSQGYHDGNKYYTGTDYKITLYKTVDSKHIAVLQVNECYDVEIGVGDGSVDYRDAEYYHKICDVKEEWLDGCDLNSADTDRERLLSVLLSAEWSETHFSSFSIQSDIEEISDEDKIYIIPANVSDIGDSVINFTRYKGVTVEEGSKHFKDVDGLIYSIDGKKLIFCAKNKENVIIADGTEQICDKAFGEWCGKTVVFPDGLKKLGDGCFWFAPNVEKITLPESVTEIGNSAFCGCEALRELHLSDDISELPSQLCSSCKSLEAVNIPKNAVSLGKNAFEDCKALAELTFPKGVSLVGKSAFCNCGIKRVRFLGDVEFSEHAFLYCSSLCEVIIDGALIGVGNEAFRGCLSLKSVTAANGSRAASGVIGYRAFYGCSALEHVTVSYGISKIASDAFSFCTTLSALELPESMNTVEGSAFSGCTSLEYIRSAAASLEVKSDAFENCTSLNFVKTNGDIAIGEGAFSGCSALKSFDVGGSVYEIEENAFLGCAALESFTASGTTDSVPKSYSASIDEAFRDCKALKTLTVPMGVVEVGRYAFKGCLSLTSVVFPSTVTAVGSFAFSGCTALEYTEFQSTDTVKLDICSFADCTALKSAVFKGSVKFGISPFLKCAELECVKVTGEAKGGVSGAFDGCPKFKGITKE